MRLTTILEAGRPRAAVVAGERVLPITLGDDAFESVRAIAAGGAAALERIAGWTVEQPAADWRLLGAASLAPVVPDPGGIYTVGLNYRAPGEAPGSGPERPLIYGKAASSVGAHGARLTWDRDVTANVDAECELGVVIGADGGVFGYTIIDDISSRDPWLDGDQWLIGKSMPGFCPVGPVVVTGDELDPADVGIGCRINGVAIQDGRTSQMRFGIAEQLRYLGRHLTLRPGDLIATGTPARLDGEYGSSRHLERGDVVTCWIEGIGELTTRIA
jgi:2-keto-4-pentenoate hydratase/2-oxohepta-3-ene-1,7-dioic acid hydratase in catechol pathway